MTTPSDKPLDKSRQRLRDKILAHVEKHTPKEPYRTNMVDSWIMPLVDDYLATERQQLIAEITSIIEKELSGFEPGGEVEAVLNTVKVQIKASLVKMKKETK